MTPPDEQWVGQGNGPGKYNHIATLAREMAHADGVMLMVFGGTHGEGFEAQAPIEIMRILPQLLRTMADQMEGK